MAFSFGLSEGRASREDAMNHCRTIVAGTSLPISADLEKGFGGSPESVAETMRAAAGIGLAGRSIEDYTNRPDDPIFYFGLAVERVAAAAQARPTLPDDFVLTARCENFLWDRRDLDNTIRRLQAFESAGADVLYGPGSTTSARFERFALD
jgi:2-methylisocitrate lyase-like PEP mutase family enzyme